MNDEIMAEWRKQAKERITAEREMVARQWALLVANERRKAVLDHKRSVPDASESDPRANHLLTREVQWVRE